MQQDLLKLDPRLMGLLPVCAGIGWIVGAALYSRLCRRFPLRLLLVAGIALNGLGTLLYLRYDSAPAAAAIEAVFGVLFSLGALPLYDLAARATPKGSESFGFGLMLSIANIGQFAISDPVGSLLYAHYHFGSRQAGLGQHPVDAGGASVRALFARALLAAREGTAAAPPPSGSEANSEP